MKIVSVLAQKGGVGKTTLTLHWAVEASVSRRHTRVAVIDIDIQGSAASWGIRREQETPMILQANEDTVKDALTACEENGVDMVFIDTMPRVERSSVEAAKVADLCIIPCGPTILDIEAIGSTIEIVNRVNATGVIVVNQGRPSSRINEQAISVLSQYDMPVCPVHIMRRAALSDAFTDGRAIRELAPISKGAKEITDSWKWLKKQIGD